MTRGTDARGERPGRAAGAAGAGGAAREAGPARPGGPTRRRLDAHDACLLLGLAFLWPFLTVATHVHGWGEPVAGAAADGGALPFSTAYSLLLILAFALILAFRRFLGPLLGGSRAFAAAMGAAGAVGAAMPLVADSLPAEGSQASGALALVGVALLAAFVSTYVVGWGARVLDDCRARGTARTVAIGLAGSALARSVAAAYYCLDIDQSALLVARPLACSLFLALSMPRPASAARGPRAVAAPAPALPALRRLPWAAIIPAVALLYVTSMVAQVLAGFDFGSMTPVGHIVNAVVIVAVTALLAAAMARARDMGDVLLVSAAVFVAGAAALTAVAFVPAAVDGVTFVVRACLLTFLWAVFACASAERRVPATVGFSAFGVLGVALMGVRVLDHAALLQALAASSFGAQIVAVGLFAATSAAVAAVALRRRRSARAVAAGQEDWQRELCGRAAASGGLTAREAEVVYYTYRGYSAAGVGGRLGVSEYTVKNHLANAYRKLDVHSKQELIAYVDSFR